MRHLLITADDYGIGTATSQGILELAQKGVVTSSVLMANSPYAEQSVMAWQAAGRPMELGWHPALTIDRPVAPVGKVHSLVDRDGKFYPLGTFLRRLFSYSLDMAHIQLELEAQFERCSELLGERPYVVNMHHHLHVFKPIGEMLQTIITRNGARPYFRLVREPWPMLWRVPGARLKRVFLNWHGRRAARTQRARGLVGNDWLIGVSDPRSVQDGSFFKRLLRIVPGRIVELTCHPGRRDETLIGRDCTETDGMLERRVQEHDLLSEAGFLQAMQAAGFALISPGQLARMKKVLMVNAA